MTDWRTLSRDAAFESHRLIGWLYWDPRAIANYAALGIPDGRGYYIASRAGALGDAGNDVVTAAFYSIHAGFVAFALDECRKATTFEEAARARDAAVVDGLREYAPEICDDLAAMAAPLWAAADALPISGHTVYAAHLHRRRPDEALLSAWLAVNCIREWRGDTHWAIQIAEGIGPIEAGVLDGAWRAYRDDWLAKSRGADDAALSDAYVSLERRGLAADGAVTERGIVYRQSLEDRLDDLAALAWQHLGVDQTRRFIDVVSGVSDRFIERVDATAGPNWMPAARHRSAGGGSAS